MSQCETLKEPVPVQLLLVAWIPIRATQLIAADRNRSERAAIPGVPLREYGELCRRRVGDKPDELAGTVQ